MTRPTKPVLLARLARAEAEIARLRAAEKGAVRRPNEAADTIRQHCSHEQETFVALYLDARQRVLAAHVVAVGSLAEVEVHPREVFRDAVRICAHALVVGHNHPSGSPEPSTADIDLTSRLVECGRLLGIPVLDHIVVTHDDYRSLATEGVL